MIMKKETMTTQTTCPACAGEPEPGYIEMNNNGPKQTETTPMTLQDAIDSLKKSLAKGTK